MNQASHGLVRQQPTYRERLKSREARAKQSALLKLRSVFLFVLYNLACLTVSLAYRIIYFGKYRNIDPNFLKYEDAHGFWQLTGNWFKSIEGIFFQNAELESPSLEIGLCRGTISARHFSGKIFDYGTEYMFFEIPQARDTFGLWKYVFSDELSSIALRDECMQTICSVHVVDHLEDIDKPFAEIARVLKPGGRLYFSGASDAYFDYSLIWQLLAWIAPAAGRHYRQTLLRRRNIYNLYGEKGWREAAGRHGLELESFEYIQDGFFAYFRYFLHYVFFVKGCFRLDLLNNEASRSILGPLFRFYFISIGYPEFLRSLRRGLKTGEDFVCVLRKSNPASIKVN